MRIIEWEKYKAPARLWHIITTEAVDKRRTTAIIFADTPAKTYISLVAAAEIAGVSETGVRDYLKKHGARPKLFTVPANVNRTGQARKMAFIDPLTMFHILLEVDPREQSVRGWFHDLTHFDGDEIPKFWGMTNIREAAIIEDKAREIDLLEIPDFTPPARVEFDATGGIEQLNRIISDLNAPYHVRVKALQIQHEVNQLANTVNALNDGKDA